MNHVRDGLIEAIIGEECFVILKPGNHSTLSSIMNTFVNARLTPKTPLIEFNFTKEMLVEFYPNIAKKNFFETEFVPYMTSGSCYLAIFKGFNIAKDLLALIGPETNPHKNAPHTIRRRFGQSIMKNCIHCPRTEEEKKIQHNVLKKYGVI
ncbi:MAG TPA: nucleoside-diphosphate kinase [bacterium]|nr:nucleoside-diphosphate kinase [bacterium]